MNIPNALTILRVVLIGVFVYLFVFTKANVAALIVFVAAAVSDILDGYIARKYDIITTAGKLLDPLADKLMLIAALSCFVIEKLIPVSMLIIMVIKEALMVAGGIFLYKKKIVVYADTWGKAATVFFNVGVGLALLSTLVDIGNAHVIVLWVSLGLGVIAFGHYLQKNMLAPAIRRKKEAGTQTQDN